MKIHVNIWEFEYKFKILHVNDIRKVILEISITVNATLKIPLKYAKLS